jgi:hypothetical protein
MFSLLAIGVLGLASPESDCLSYSAPASIAGVISVVHPSPPQAGTTEAQFFVLLPQAPVCVNAGTNADGLEPETHALNVELGVTDAQTFRLLRASVGRTVVCRGNIASPSVGHHLRATDLVLWSPHCTGA